MNPWMIVGWIGAICTSVVMIALTAAIVVASLKPNKKPGTTTNVYVGR